MTDDELKAFQVRLTSAQHSLVKNYTGTTPGSDETAISIAVSARFIQLQAAIDLVSERLEHKDKPTAALMSLGLSQSEF